MDFTAPSIVRLAIVAVLFVKSPSPLITPSFIGTMRLVLFLLFLFVLLVFLPPLLLLLGIILLAFVLLLRTFAFAALPLVVFRLMWLFTCVKGGKVLIVRQ